MLLFGFVRIHQSLYYLISSLANINHHRDEHKVVEKHELVRNIIFKAGQPRLWFTSSGKMLQIESPGTTRAQELAEIYRILEIEEDVEGDDRVPGLAALKAKVSVWFLKYCVTK